MKRLDYPKVNRVEVIDYTKELARDYVNWKDESVKVWVSLQDDDRTMKIFIEPVEGK